MNTADFYGKFIVLTVKSFFQQIIRKGILVLILLLYSFQVHSVVNPDSNDVFIADSNVMKIAQEFDRQYFPLFLESLHSVRSNDFPLVPRFFKQNCNDTLFDTIELPILSSYNAEVIPVYINPNGHPNHPVRFPVLWEVPGKNDPSWNLWFKSLSWLNVYLNSGNNDSVIVAFKVLEDYICSHVDYPDPDSRFTFGDHASSERLKTLTKAYLRFCNGGFHQDRFKVLLQNAILTHVFYLGSLEFYECWSNHAIIVDNALIESLSLLHDFVLRRQFLDLAFCRVFEQIRYSFSFEGVHKEHSPCYHLIFARTVESLISKAIKLDIKVPFIVYRLNANALLYSKLLYSLNRGLSIGDCNQVASRRSEQNYYKHGLRIYPHSGWAFFKDSTSRINITVQSDFNSFIHYQNDESSFVLDVGKHRLIIDPGLFSYDKTSPYNEYMRSARAHNVLLVGDELPTTQISNTGLAGITRYFRPGSKSLSGSGIIELTHPHYMGIGVELFRDFAFLHGNILFICDSLKSASFHDYYQLFHLAKGATIDVRNNGIIVSWSEHPFCLRIESNAEFDSLIEGSLNPYQGWCFPEFRKEQSAPVLVLKISGSSCVVSTRIKVFREGHESKITRKDRRQISRLMRDLSKVNRNKLSPIEIPGKWETKRTP